MAIGKRLFGHPWFGVWLSCGALAAALLWALEGWFAPSWALFGTLLAIPLCSFSYWMNSYMGGSVAAIGGALVALLLMTGLAAVVVGKRVKPE